MAEIVRAVVPADAVVAVRRLVWRDLFRRGLLPDEVRQYRDEACWFPWLRGFPQVAALADALPASLCDGERCEPQLVVHPPDDQLGEITPHVDEPPPWANGRRYRRIVGVAVTEQRRENGGLWTWPDEYGDPEPVPPLDPGDAVVLDPDELHASGWNVTGDVRIAAYVRFLQPA